MGLLFRVIKRSVVDGMNGQAAGQYISGPVIDRPPFGIDPDGILVLAENLFPEPGMLDHLELNEAEDKDKKPYAQKKRKKHHSAGDFFLIHGFHGFNSLFPKADI
jgi:hypothetical protein